MEASLFIKRRMSADSRELAFLDILQRPGGCPEEMQHGLTTAWSKGPVNGHKPVEDSSLAGKTGFKVAQNIFNKI